VFLGSLGRGLCSVENFGKIETRKPGKNKIKNIYADDGKN
jgi:hypothetical protein